MIRMIGVIASCKEKLIGVLEILVEIIQDFIDFVYIFYQYREFILQICDRFKLEMSVLFRISKVSRVIYVEMNVKFKVRCVV